MKAQVFDEIRKIVYAESGIRILDGREGMVASRLSQRLRALSLNDVEEYLDYLRTSLEKEVVQLLDVISTNVTHFFREAEHFDFYREYLGELLGQGQRKLRIWCAASSTGEEPYTLAMVLSEVVRELGEPVDSRILATDISTRVLAKAKEGVYAEDKVAPIPAQLKQRYFRGSFVDDVKRYEVKDILKSMLLFKRLNLSAPPFPMKGPMDVIFCRNVMIYFDDKVRDALVTEFLRILRPGGRLIVGQSESLLRWGDALDAIGPAVYVKRG